jgi:hypothetical protein
VPAPRGAGGGQVLTQFGDGGGGASGGQGVPRRAVNVRSPGSMSPLLAKAWRTDEWASWLARGA